MNSPSARKSGSVGKCTAAWQVFQRCSPDNAESLSANRAISGTKSY
jgi:hypothetical protein